MLSYKKYITFNQIHRDKIEIDSLDTPFKQGREINFFKRQYFFSLFMPDIFKIERGLCVKNPEGYSCYVIYAWETDIGCWC